MSGSGYRGHTVTTYMRQKPPTPYGGLLRTVAVKFKKLQDEIATESVAGLEFEECTRKTLNVLNGQVVTLKDAFNTLVDVLTAEMDMVKSAAQNEVTSVIERVELQHKHTLRATDEQAERVEAVREQLTVDRRELTRDVSEARETLSCEISLARSEASDAARRVEQVVQDVDTLRKAIPRMEERLQESQQQTTTHFQEKTDRLASMVERVDSHSRNVDSSLREELESRHIRLQKSITSQLERMSRVLIEPESPGRDASRPPPVSPSRSEARGSVLGGTSSAFGGGGGEGSVRGGGSMFGGGAGGGSVMEGSVLGGEGSRTGGLLRVPAQRLSTVHSPASRQSPTASVTGLLSPSVGGGTARGSILSGGGAGGGDRSPSVGGGTARGSVLSGGDRAPASPSAGRQSGRATPVGTSDMIFDLLDQNKDGVVNRDEWDRAMGGSRLSDALRRPPSVSGASRQSDRLR